MAKLYRAKEKGFRHGNLVQVGDEFYLDKDERPGKWMEEVGSEAPAKPPKKVVNGDTKPAAAQEAVKEKVAEVGSSLV